jgi:hypothetical protein
MKPESQDNEVRANVHCQPMASKYVPVTGELVTMETADVSDTTGREQQ